MKLKTKNEVKELRMEIGKFLHDYYVRFGDDKYEVFLEHLGPAMERQYGEPFSCDNLRIMEAEFVTFNSKIKEKHASKVREDTKQ